MKIETILLVAACLGAASAGMAQDQTSTTLDGQTITVKVAPGASKKYAVASFQTASDVAFKGVRVPKGSYTLYVMPEGAQWHLVVNKATGAKAAAYDAKLDVGHVILTMAKGTAGPACQMTLTRIAAVAARLDVSWNGTVASAPFHLDRGGNDTEW
jgi:hypothetical protein